MAIAYNKRTCDCGTLRAADVGRQVILAGWVNNYRDHGDNLVFIDLRDRGGLTQCRFNVDTDPEATKLARTLRKEDCVAVRGEVIHRGENVNPKLPTGEIEVSIQEVEVLNKSLTPPFEVADHVEANEDLRLKYRFLDLRRGPMQRAIIMRHKVTQAFRTFYYNEGFLDVETPILTKSTPEGARDYLVPSRVWPGKFYALPQSPQLFKQLLMMSGFDRYMQIARCFRDEDLRADRQPDFTQVDLEMAFVDVDNVLDVVERSLAYVWKEAAGIEVPVPFRRMPYDEAMRDYGSDKPDLRYGMKLIDVTEVAGRSEFKVFRDAVERGGVVKAICLTGVGEMTRKETDGLTVEIQGVGAGGLPLCKVVSEGGKTILQTGIAKFFPEGLAGDLIAAIIMRRLEREKDAARFQAEHGAIYQPRNSYSLDQKVLFTALDFRQGQVVGVRAGRNPKYGDFQVIRVALDDGTEREYGRDDQSDAPLLGRLRQIRVSDGHARRADALQHRREPAEVLAARLDTLLHATQLHGRHHAHRARDLPEVLGCPDFPPQQAQVLGHRGQISQTSPSAAGSSPRIRCCSSQDPLNSVMASPSCSASAFTGLADVARPRPRHWARVPTDWSGCGT